VQLAAQRAAARGAAAALTSHAERAVQKGADLADAAENPPALVAGQSRSTHSGSIHTSNDKKPISDLARKNKSSKPGITRENQSEWGLHKIRKNALHRCPRFAAVKGTLLNASRSGRRAWRSTAAREDPGNRERGASLRPDRGLGYDNRWSREEPGGGREHTQVLPRPIGPPPREGRWGPCRVVVFPCSFRPALILLTYASGPADRTVLTAPRPSRYNSPFLTVARFVTVDVVGRLSGEISCTQSSAVAGSSIA
jgi:hypothetical protein